MGLSLAYRTQGHYLAALNAFEIVLVLEGLDPSIKRLALINLGELFIELGNYKRAIEYFKQNVELAETSTDLKIKMDASEKLGNTYFNGGFYNKTTEQYLLVLDLAKQFNYPEQQVTALANLVWSYSKGNLKVAKDYAQQSVELSKHIVDPWRKSESLHALVTLQHYTKDPDSIKTANKLLTLSQQNKGFPVSLALEILGNTHEQAGDTAKAIHFYQQSLSLTRQEQDLPQEGSALTSLGYVYQKAGNLELAESAFRQAIEIWESLRNHLKNKDKLKVSLLDKQRVTYQELQGLLI